MNVHRDLRLVTLMNFQGAKLEVPDDSTEMVVVGTPRSWPFISIAVKPAAGPIVRVVRNEQDLVPLEDWMVSDPSRAGGSIFFNPKLALKIGEVLAAVHKSGVSSRIQVSTNFASLKTRKARNQKENSVKKPASIDRLLHPFLDDD